MDLLLVHLILGSLSLFSPIKCDPNPIFDYCVANNTKKSETTLFLNGVPCINPEHTLASHFASSVLSKSGYGDISESNFDITFTNIDNFPGLNTLGLAMTRIDIGVNGLVPPHSHLRASELVILFQGSLLVGFVDTSGRLYRQQLSPGDIFIFPKGLVHFLFNLESNKSALAISGLNSQNPGAQISSQISSNIDMFISNEILRTRRIFGD